MSDSRAREISAQITAVADNVEKRFQRGRRVLSFHEYLELFATDPVRYARDASRYLKDSFEHYGTEDVEHPWGKFTRWKLFDLPWEEPVAVNASNGKPDLRPRGALIGQEHVQQEVHRVLANFAREGKPNRLLLLHGPNGSAKSTIVGCLIRGLEHYSTLDEGALYRFNWVFPSTKTIRGSLGFGQGGTGGAAQATYAHLADDQIDAKLLVEVRDHPLFLFPLADRRQLLERLFKDANETPNDWILRGQLSHKSQQVFEALLASYQGSYTEVLKHVQVERYFISQRYRVGAVTIGPQMSVDAGERQITADRSLSALPASLQAITLYEAKGELVEAAGGLLEFSDLLKRPLDAFKYLQLSVETGEVALTQQNVQLNCVMMGSANELHLDAFREHPEFASFRGRLELVRVPYLRNYKHEQQIYDAHVAPQVRRHVAPHATAMAAMFAVLTRMRKPNADRYSRGLSAALSGLTAVEKMDPLRRRAPAGAPRAGSAEAALRSNIKEIFEESDSYPIYEGRIGASPREMRVVIMDASAIRAVQVPIAARRPRRDRSAHAEQAEFEWLQQDAIAGGYHDVKQFRESLFSRLLTTWEQELYATSGLIDEQKYAELFGRYIEHVSVWVKKERIRNRATGEHEEPDEKMMKEVERLLDMKGEAQDQRRQMISAIAAWAIDHPGLRIDPGVVFPPVREANARGDLRRQAPAVAILARDIIIVVRENGVGLDAARKRDAEAVIERLIARFGYCRNCALDMASMIMRKRFHDLVV